MTTVKTKAKGKSGLEVSSEVEFNFGEDFQEAVDKWGEEVVYTYFKAHAKVVLQGAIRNNSINVDDEGNESARTAEEIQEFVNTYKLEKASRTKKTAAEKALEMARSMTTDELDKFLKKLRSGELTSA